MRYLGIFAFLLSILGTTKAQESKLITGQVLGLDQQPLAFCTIGILGKDIGTVSSVDGLFEVEIPIDLVNDSLTFSFVGFKTERLPIHSMLDLNDNRVYLEENVIKLEEIVVSSKKPKIHEFGYFKEAEVFLWLKGKTNGAEIATLLSPSKKIHLNTVSIEIENEERNEFQLLISIYEKSASSKLPGKQLLNKRVLVTSNQPDGWLDVDLSDQHLIINNPIYVSFKWVDITNKSPKIGMNFKAERSYLRVVALGEWNQYLNPNIKASGTVIKN